MRNGEQEQEGKGIKSELGNSKNWRKLPRVSEGRKAIDDRAMK